MVGQSCYGNHSHHLMLEFLFIFSLLTLCHFAMSMKYMARNEEFYQLMKFFIYRKLIFSTQHFQRKSKGFKKNMSLILKGKSIVTENMTRVLFVDEHKNLSEWIMKHENRSRDYSILILRNKIINWFRSFAFEWNSFFQFALVAPHLH